MLKVANLRKTFDGVRAVDGVSLEVRRGELFGLLGPNGAGKTTTIRTVLNIIAPDGGVITFDGRPFDPQTWNIIGYLPEERGLYRKSKIINTILYFASLKGIPEREAKPLALHWLDRFGLKESAHQKVEELSRGNQQKIQLIISILHRPQLLILDEPFSGLDPVNQILLKDVLLELRQKNAAIIFSTHHMEEVEKMCDNICLINKGKPVLSGSLRDVKSQYGTNSVRLEYEGDGTFLKELPFVKRADVYQNYAELELVDIQRSRELLLKLDDRLSLRKFEIIEPSLNSIFLHVVGQSHGSEEAPAARPIIQRPPRTPMDARVEKALLSLVMVGVTSVILIVAMYAMENITWTIPTLVAVAILGTAFRFMKTKRDVEMERRRAGKGRAR